METKKALSKINTNVLDNIQKIYVSDIKEIEQYYPEHLKNKVAEATDKIKDQILTTGRRMTSGIKSSIPMKCKGKKCCLAPLCALLKNKMEPLGYHCPYEELMVDKLTAEYYNSLSIDPFNRTERDQVKQMVELIIIDNRASADISENGLYSTQVTGATNKGIPIYNEVESLAYNIKMRTQVRIEKLQNELLASRKIRKQLEVDKRDDPASKASSLLDKYKELVETEVVVENVKSKKSNKK